MAGDGVPNQAPWGHYRGDVTSGPVGYFFHYHDQQVTGNEWKRSLEMSPAEYAALRAAAFQSQAAFETVLFAGSWGGFFSLYPGIHKQLARLSVQRTE